MSVTGFNRKRRELEAKELKEKAENEVSKKKKVAKKDGEE